VSCDPLFNFDACYHISGAAEVTVAKFCMQVEYIKRLAFDDRLFSNGCGQGHVTWGFFNFAPNTDEARYFKFHVLTDTWDSKCKHHVLPAKGMCDVSSVLLKFWETTNNI